MRYLNEENIKEIGTNWDATIEVIESSIKCLIENDYAQPLKPYLRFKELKNRIIAMPAYVGGKINLCGIKWIASFPDNTKRGMQRAHSVVILNDTETGKPVGILNSGAVSAIRTASVSGFVLKKYLNERQLKTLKIGIVGFGIIGKYHLKMALSLIKNSDVTFFLYDINEISTTGFTEEELKKVTIVDSWEKAYSNADVFITTTCSKERYIDKKPKQGSLHLNVSLRDYKPEAFDWFKTSVIVDDWEEVCRENTDIEKFHLEKGLQKSDVRSIKDVVKLNCFEFINTDQAFMFNPMGMAIFDIAISESYLQHGNTLNIGTVLN